MKEALELLSSSEFKDLDITRMETPEDGIEYWLKIRIDDYTDIEELQKIKNELDADESYISTEGGDIQAEFIICDERTQKEKNNERTVELEGEISEYCINHDNHKNPNYLKED